MSRRLEPRRALHETSKILANRAAKTWHDDVERLLSWVLRYGDRETLARLQLKIEVFLARYDGDI